MKFRLWLESEEGMYGKIVSVSLASDSFLHFTPMSRARQIMESGKFLMNPPYKKFGTDTVDAISVNYGRYVPGVQLSHTKTTPNDPIVAVHFKTNVLPYAGYPEEVKWNQDVSLMNASIISTQEAQKMLQHPSAFRQQAADDYELDYK